MIDAILTFLGISEMSVDTQEIIVSGAIILLIVLCSVFVDVLYRMIHSIFKG